MSAGRGEDRKIGRRGLGSWEQGIDIKLWEGGGFGGLLPTSLFPILLS